MSNAANNSRISRDLSKNAQSSLKNSSAIRRLFSPARQKRDNGALTLNNDSKISNSVNCKSNNQNTVIAMSNGQKSTPVNQQRNKKCLWITVEIKCDDQRHGDAASLSGEDQTDRSIEIPVEKFPNVSLEHACPKTQRSCFTLPSTPVFDDNLPAKVQRSDDQENSREKTPLANFLARHSLRRSSNKSNNKIITDNAVKGSAGSPNLSDMPLKRHGSAVRKFEEFLATLGSPIRRRQKLKNQKKSLFSSHCNRVAASEENLTCSILQNSSSTHFSNNMYKTPLDSSASMVISSCSQDCMTMRRQILDQHNLHDQVDDAVTMPLTSSSRTPSYIRLSCTLNGYKNYRRVNLNEEFKALKTTAASRVTPQGKTIVEQRLEMFGNGASKSTKNSPCYGNPEHQTNYQQNSSQKIKDLMKQFNGLEKKVVDRNQSMYDNEERSPCRYYNGDNGNETEKRLLNGNTTGDVVSQIIDGLEKLCDDDKKIIEHLKLGDNDDSRSILADNRSITDVVKVGQIFKEKSLADKSRLETWIDLAERDLMNQADFSEYASDELRAAVGNARLLLRKKFAKFQELIEKNLNPKPEDNCPAFDYDLEAYSELVQLELADVESRFKKIEKMRQNNWQEIEEEILPPSAKIQKFYSQTQLKLDNKNKTKQQALSTSSLNSLKNQIRAKPRENVRQKIQQAKMAAAAAEAIRRQNSECSFERSKVNGFMIL